jgi:hypothetical protein
MPHTEVVPFIFGRVVPITSAGFVSNISEPSVMPPPKISRGSLRRAGQVSHVNLIAP